jgi:hypothetical protein
MNPRRLEPLGAILETTYQACADIVSLKLFQNIFKRKTLLSFPFYGRGNGNPGKLSKFPPHSTI